MSCSPSVSAVDTVRSEVIAEGRRIPYDDLIVATGAQHAYFGQTIGHPMRRA